MNLKWIPNAICVVRILLIFPLVVALLEQRYALALLLILVAGGSDAVDGFLAKHYDWRTRLGSLLDPAADKLLITSAFLTLTYLDLVPLGLAVVVIGRDLVIVSGAVAYQYLFGRLEGEPTLISKANTGCQLVFVVLTIAAAEFSWRSELLTLLGAAVVFTSITSGLNYVVVWTKRTRAQRQAA